MDKSLVLVLTPLGTMAQVAYQEFHSYTCQLFSLAFCRPPLVWSIAMSRTPVYGFRFSWSYWFMNQAAG
jgi:hypothetical protein